MDFRVQKHEGQVTTAAAIRLRVFISFSFFCPLCSEGPKLVSALIVRGPAALTSSICGQIGSFVSTSFYLN